MIKREALKFYSQEEFNDYLSQLNDDTKILHYNVLEDAHYIITERKMSDDEAKQFKLNQLKKQIKECNERWERRIKNCEQLIHEHNVTLNHEMANAYMQRREDLIEEYNEEQRKLTKEEEPEKDIKKELHELLDKATELIYNNQEELHISFDDFITLVKIKEDLK